MSKALEKFEVFDGKLSPRRPFKYNRQTDYADIDDVYFKKYAEYVKIELSDEIDNLKQQLAILNNSLIQIISMGEAASSYGDGGGGMDNLEKRVENLEKKVETINERLSNVEKDIVLIKEQTKKLDSLPTTTEIQFMLTQAITEALKPIPNDDRIKSIIREEIKDLPDQYKTKDIVRAVIDDKKLTTEDHVSLVVKNEIGAAKTSALKFGIPLLVTIVAASAALGTFLINLFKSTQ
jgi:DNA repair exonuclease SbcCD ATPase subunit